MKTLIFSDIHNGWEWAEKVIKEESADRIIFAGDHFDSKHEHPNDISETADWLHSSVNQPNRIHLHGNHDVQYAFPHEVLQVSRYAQWKKATIDTFVTKADWNRFRYYYELDHTWLITHAGLHPHYVPKETLKGHKNRREFYKNIKGVLNSHISQIESGFVKKDTPLIFNVGYSRGGWAWCGHILWLDFNEEFTPITGLNQIFGHTPQQFPTWSILRDQKRPEKLLYDDPDVELTPESLNNVDCSFNLCLDTKSQYYATWNKGKLKVKHA